MATALTTGAEGTNGWTFAATQVFANVIQTVSLWRQRSQTRDELVRMDSRMLQDIGISHSEALMEGQKHFWQE